MARERDELEQRVERAAGGDRAAMAGLLESQLARLRTFVRMRAGAELRARESCTDLVQSVCREVVEELPRLAYQNEDAFRGWLLGIADRKLIDRARYWHAAKRDGGLEQPLPDWSAVDDDAQLAESLGTLSTPSRDAIAREELERVERALAEMPDHYRQVIAWSRLAGLPHAEIAARLGKTEVAVRGLLFRALAELSERIADEPTA